ncbi:MAG: ATP-binding protein, partial [Actinomycetota bacterium]|nr:ATP-binding protein [Actinomycetota bacterium]
SRVGTAEVRFPQTGPATPDRAFAAAVERSVAAAGLGAGLMAVIVGVLLARRVAAPVRDLTGAARALAGGQRSARLQPSSPDELGEMASAFNAMADAIDTEDRLRCDFARDVAHELRTPLMILQSQLEALQDGLAEPTPTTLGSLHDETLRLGRLVADLETLASAAGTSFTMENHVVDLSDLVGGAVAGFANPMREAGLTVVVEAADEVAVVGDPTRLRQVVTNLLSNAAKFVPHGGAVRIDVRNDDGSAVLIVADDGPGIAPTELGTVFDRFCRGSGARTGGSGIGLSVVSDIVAAHHGEVTVANEPGHGARFTVRLPQATRHAHRDFAGSSRPPRSVIGS